jgi:hypothetical protein
MASAQFLCANKPNVMNTKQVSELRLQWVACETPEVPPKISIIPAPSGGAA